VWSASKEQGSAVTDFILVALPMLVIFVSTISLSLGSYARVVLLDATIEGARYAGLADQDIEAGIVKTQLLVSKSLGDAAVVRVEGSLQRIGDVQSVLFVSSLALSISPSSTLITVRSVATREIEY
jgi:hypothetical protein